MATISKVLALPSATQYNSPSAPSYTNSAFTGIGNYGYFEYGQVAYGGTPTNKVSWVEPTPSFFKNKESSVYRFRLTRTSDNVLVRDDILGNYITEGQSLQTSLGLVVAGTDYKVEIYTSVNGSRSSYNTATFTAMTAPEAPPEWRTGVGYGWTGYAYAPYGNVMQFDISGHTANWGTYNYHTSNKYYLDMVDTVNNTTTTTYEKNGANPVSTTLPFQGEWLYYDLVPSKYRVYVKAGNYAGYSPRVENPNTASTTNGSTILSYGPPTISSFTPTFGYRYDTVTITGTWLKNPASAAINNYSANIVSSSYDTLVLSVPFIGYGFSTTGPITVTSNTNNGTTQSTASSTDTFTIGATPYPSYKRCTSLNRSMGLCYTINCCCYDPACSGATCTSPNC